jgi:hypothetical protein
MKVKYSAATLPFYCFKDTPCGDLRAQVARALFLRPSSVQFLPTATYPDTELVQSLNSDSIEIFTHGYFQVNVSIDDKVKTFAFPFAGKVFDLVAVVQYYMSRKSRRERVPLVRFSLGNTDLFESEHMSQHWRPDAIIVAMVSGELTDAREVAFQFPGRTHRMRLPASGSVSFARCVISRMLKVPFDEVQLVSADRVAIDLNQKISDVVGEIVVECPQVDVQFHDRNRDFTQQNVPFPIDFMT